MVQTQIVVLQKEDRAVHAEADEGPQTVIDAHRRRLTVKNERMAIVLEVTHADDESRRGTRSRIERNV